MSILIRESFFGFPSARPFVSRDAKIDLFERAIFEKSLSSVAPALRFLVFFWGTGARHPPAHFSDLELTGTKKGLPSSYYMCMCKPRVDACEVAQHSV